MKLKPCPFCGGLACKNMRLPLHGEKMKYRIICIECDIQTAAEEDIKKAIEAWNRRTTVETNIYDKEETYPDCTVQVLTNTATGETSVGWWINGGGKDGK